MDRLHDLTALEQAAAIRRGELSPVDIVEHYLERVDALNETLGAFMTPTPDQAIAQARAAEKQLAGDRADLPPLFGVPLAIKDLTPTAGVRTTFGSRAYADFVPETDAHSVTLLRAAGTISLGKTNTPEFGTGPYTDNDVVGPARNPWDLQLSAGGSSGGAAAAVAGGLIPFAHGSDGGGSLRIPTSVCGLVGMKPSRGRVSPGPAADVHGLSVQGPVARTVRDAAALLDALAVPMPGDTGRVPDLPPGESFLGHAEREPGRLRIGAYAQPPTDDVTVDPVCVEAWKQAVTLLGALGHEVEEIACPFEPQFRDHFVTVWSVMALDLELDPAREELLRPVTKAWRARGRSVSAERYTRAVRALREAARAAILKTAEYDVVLTPTLGLPPQRIDFFAEDGDVLGNLRRQAAFTPFTGVYNVTGQPAVNLPLHWTADGLPIGVSLVGRPADEATLIRLAAQLEAARPWAHRRPPCWGRLHRKTHDPLVKY